VNVEVELVPAAANRKLLAKKGGDGGGSTGTGGKKGSRKTDGYSSEEDAFQQYLGYEVRPALEGYRPPVSYYMRRYVGLHNRVVGGMLLRLGRNSLSSGSPRCSPSRFQTLDAPCLDPDVRSDQERFGSDPVFRMSQSSLYRPELQPFLDAFFNTSEGSLMVHKILTTNRPLPFERRAGLGLGDYYPVFWDAGLLGNRAQQLVKYVYQGQFFDDAFSELKADIITYNPNLRRVMINSPTFTRSAGGKIEASVETRVFRVGSFFEVNNAFDAVSCMAQVLWAAIIFGLWGRDLCAWCCAVYSPETGSLTGSRSRIFDRRNFYFTRGTRKLMFRSGQTFLRFV
jgi:hypothetical protein